MSSRRQQRPCRRPRDAAQSLSRRASRTSCSRRREKGRRARRGWGLSWSSSRLRRRLLPLLEEKPRCSCRRRRCVQGRQSRRYQQCRSPPLRAAEGGLRSFGCSIAVVGLSIDWVVVSLGWRPLKETAGRDGEWPVKGAVRWSCEVENGEIWGCLYRQELLQFPQHCESRVEVNYGEGAPNITSLSRLGSTRHPQVCWTASTAVEKRRMVLCIQSARSLCDLVNSASHAFDPAICDPSLLLCRKT
ncbi:hypothetical protein IWZ01DRAFT_515899 [Phyllosticta capitalensis]